jgi:hypothetical protein
MLMTLYFMARSGLSSVFNLGPQCCRRANEEISSEWERSPLAQTHHSVAEVNDDGDVRQHGFVERAGGDW